MSIKDLKKNAPKGEFLAYINKEEAALLKKHGGSGKLVNGIPSFIGFDAGTIGTDGKQGGKGSNKGLSGGYQGGTLGGMGDADRDGPTARNPYDKGKVRNKEIRDEQKFNYNKQFYDKGKIGPSHSRKSFLQKNRIQKNIKNIQRLQKTRMNKLQQGLMTGNIPGIDTMTMQEMIDLAPSMKSFGFTDKTINDILSGKRANIDFAVPSGLPSTLGIVTDQLGKVMSGPVTNEKLNELFSEYNDLGKLDPTKQNTFDLMKEYEPNRYAREFGPSSGGDNNQPFIPINYNTGAAEGPDYDGTNQFTYDENAFGPGGQSKDVRLGTYNFNQGGRARRAEGGIMELRARRAFGGIMDRVTGRKAYGLGSIFKSVGKAVSGVAKAAGKVLKSDLGKAALFAVGAYYAPTMFGGTAGFGSGSTYGKAFSALKNSKLATGIMGLKDSYSGMGKLGKAATWAGIGLGASMIPGLNKPKPNEDSYADRGGSLIDPITGLPAKPAEMRASLNNALNNADGDPIRIKQINDAYAFLGPDERLGTFEPYRTYGVKDGGRIGKAEGGLMDLGGMEKDYRAEGGFVPIGAKEKADDVPARLSVNEFVFTADAVRGAGGGDIDKGAEIMENMMVNLEKGGTVSEESQGNAGAQQMFNTSERLGEVI